MMALMELGSVAHVRAIAMVLSVRTYVRPYAPLATLESLVMEPVLHVLRTCMGLIAILLAHA